MQMACMPADVMPNTQTRLYPRQSNLSQSTYVLEECCLTVLLLGVTSHHSRIYNRYQLDPYLPGNEGIDAMNQHQPHRFGISFLTVLEWVSVEQAQFLERRW